MRGAMTIAASKMKKRVEICSATICPCQFIVCRACHVADATPRPKRAMDARDVAKRKALSLTPKFSGAGAKRRAPTPKGLASAATHS